jgi:DNA-binding NtrC family response regulator
VDRDAAASGELVRILKAAGIDARSVRESRALARELTGGDVDVVVAEESEAAEAPLTELGDSNPSLVILSSFGSVEGAVRAMRTGAAHYCAKPVSAEEIVLAVRRAAEARRLRQEHRALSAALDGRQSFGALTARDPKMREVFTLLETVAQTRATVLLLGESGTGKSVLARAIHRGSPRAKGPFVEVNCGALPDSLLESELFGHARGAFTGALRDRAGRFEAASGGTIFLDEIGTASPSLQLRLLRVLQERVVERVGESKPRSVDVRVLLATNHDLEDAVKRGVFREDLYYRIHVVAVEIPPLRERRLDIPELSSKFLVKVNAALGKSVAAISPDALARLCAHAWPGNVRELENAIERAVAVGRGRVLEAADLPPLVDGAVAAPAAATHAPAARDLDAIALGPLEGMLLACERRFLERALDAAGGNRTKAASLLGLHRATLYERMRRVGLSTSHAKSADSDAGRPTPP